MTESTRSLSTMLPDRHPEEESSRLLLFGVRRIAAGGFNDAHAANAFLFGFGLSYRRPLVLMRALMAEMSRVAERKILVAPCCCLRMTVDEATVLTTAGSAVENPHDSHRLLCGMLGVGNALGVLSSAQALGQAFADLGRPLPS